MIIRRSIFAILVAAGAVLGACGGGSNTPANSFAPAPGGGTGWQSGVFLDANTYFARCENPRSGTDPATGRPFVDRGGAVLDENNFLRSFSNDVYLWYDEIVDEDPSSFNDPLDFFDRLQTDAITSSGQRKDRFHFTYDSEEWFQLSQSGVSAGYGAQWALLRTTPPRELVVAYTEPNSPATAAGVMLARGASILTVDGVDLVNGNTQQDIETLNNAIFPSAAGETHTFEVLDLGSQTTRIITMTTEIIASAPVQNVKVIDVATEKVGYLVFNDHIATAEDALIDAVDQLLADGPIVDLVLDVRYNGGGFLDIAAQLAYMIAGPANVAGRSFETLQFNDKHPVTNPITQDPISPTPFHNVTIGFGSRPIGQPLPTLDLARVYVLTGTGTCSASEAIMNGLRGIGVEVVQIGSTTCGKPYGFYPIDNCGTTYFTIQFRGVNSNDFGDYTDGFSPASTIGSVGTVVPGCSVADDYTAALGDTSEARLAAALDYRMTQTCPASTGTTGPGINKPGSPLSAVEGVVPKSPWQMNRILRR